MSYELTKGMISDAARDRFASKLLPQREGSGCIEWGASRDTSGYGHMWLAGKIRKANRIAYALYVGDVPAEMCIIHSCDNPACCNPEHLSLGTHAENMTDRNRKGRFSRLCGEDHGSCRLSNETVLEMHKLSRLGLNQRQIGEAVGCSRGYVSKVLKGQHRALSRRVDGQ